MVVGRGSHRESRHKTESARTIDENGGLAEIRGASKGLTRSLSRDSSWELGYGERQCGFNEKHHSTKAKGSYVCEVSGVGGGGGSIGAIRRLSLKLTVLRQGCPVASCKAARRLR